LKIMMRGFASSLLRSLTEALYGSRRIRSRQNETEFPTALPRHGGASRLLESALRGRRAADRASYDALRPLNHWVKIEDQYELSFIRETSAQVAGRVSTQGRWAWALSRRSPESADENILAAGRGIFWKRQQLEETNRGIAQRLTAFALAA
jgi:hypothetical protein